jgi:predicted MPP superfamily phosphohydrolase
MTARSRLDVTEVTVRSARLPGEFDGFRVALLADLHFGPYVRADFVRRVVERARDSRPDLALLNGDMVERPGPAMGELAGMLAPLAEHVPTFATLGAHDFSAGGPGPYCRAMRAVGIDVLVNQNRLLGRDGRALSGSALAAADGPAIALVGLDDCHHGRPDCHAAFAGVPDGAFTLLAGHCPDLADQVGPAGTVDLALCGHTHGGQIAFFGWAPLTFTRNGRYRRGLVDGPGFPMYISRGLGMTGLPLRVGASPELPVVRLRTKG